MIINHNLAAMNANRNMNVNSSNASKSMQKLSSGLRINTAADDAAGLAISEKMRGQIRGLDQASSNAQDSISMVQTAEGALNETTSILQRMRELAVQSGNDTSTDSDRKAMQDETAQLKSEIDRISTTTEFNTKKLLNGSLTGASTAQGTKANSAAVGAATIAATSGSVAGGNGIVARNSVAAVAGTGGTLAGTAAIGDSTVIGATATFSIKVNGGAATDVTVAAGTYDKDGLLNAVNAGLATYNGGLPLSQTVSASYTADNKLIFTTGTTGASSNIAIAAPSAGTDVRAQLGMTTVNSSVGTDSVQAVKAGVTNIVAGANDMFEITVDGGSTQTITLDAGNYATKTDLVNQINTKLLGNASLASKVNASLDDNGKIVFKSASTGTTSGVTIAAPSLPANTDESALAVMGYAGKATTLTSASITNIAGVNLSAAADATFDLTIGKDTQTITLTGAGIDAASTRDTIANALQKAIDTKFGSGAVTVKENAGKIQLVNNTDSSKFAISNGTATLFGLTQTATPGAVGSTTTVSGSDAQVGTLANATKLVNLTDKDGNSLALTDGNVIKISGTQNGDGFSTTLNVTSTTTVADLINQMKTIPQLADATISFDIAKGQFNITGADGATKDVSNLKFTAQKSATDNTGVSEFNKQFETFTVTQKATDSKSDNSIVTQIGANQGQTMNIDINDMGTKALKLQDIDISTEAGAATALSVVDNALQAVAAERSKLGAYQNRLEHTINNLGTSSENLTAAESRIRDVDMAKEMSTYSKNNILSQAAQAMLAQANQQPQQVLQLLR